MKNKIQIIIFGVISFSLLFVVFQMASADYSYERTPIGTEITSPVSFNISVDDVIIDLNLDPSMTYWGFLLNNEMGGNSNYPDCDEQETEYSECVSVSTLSHIFTMNLCEGFSTDEIIAMGDTSKESCEAGEGDEGITFENGARVFIIVEEEAQGGVIILPESALASTTAYIGDLIGSIKGFLWLIIGIPLGFAIIKKTIILIPK